LRSPSAWVTVVEENVSRFFPNVHSEAMTRAGRFVLMLLTAVGGVACQSQSVLLKGRDGGAAGTSAAGAPGAGGSGGGTGGSSGGVAAGGTGGGAGAGGTDGGVGPDAPGPPPSTGSFPYPGRWWGRLTAPDRAGAFVIHWSASDPVDRALWTPTHTYSLDATPGPEDGVTLHSSAPEMKGCWTLYATADPDELRVQACDTPPSSGEAALGFFRRGARLIVPIYVPPVGGPPRITASASASTFGGDGQWVTASFGDHLWLWKNDVGQTYDLGAGYAGMVAFSPDGQRVVYDRLNPTPGAGYGALIGYDIATATERVVTSDGGGFSDGALSFAGLFSPDGRRFAFYERPSGSTGDLAVYDFDTDQAVTLAPDTLLTFLPADVAFVGGSGMVFRTYDPTVPAGTQPIPFYGHDFKTGTTRRLGDATELVAIPGGAFVAFRADSGPATLLDATLTPSALPGPSFLSGGQSGYAGFQPTADGKRLAYVDGAAVLHVVGLDGSPALTLPGPSGCLPDYCEQQWPPESSRPNPPRAARFTSDGQALVRAVGIACFPGGSVQSVSRYDLATEQEATLSLPQFDALAALSPLGQFVVTQTFPPLQLGSWPASLVALDIPCTSQFDAANPIYSFTDDGRYLTYVASGYLMVRDIVAGTTRQVAPLYVLGLAAVSQVTGVSVVWADRGVDGEALTAFPPDGASSLMLNATYENVLTEPRGTVVAFTTSDEAGTGTVVYHLEQGATPQLVGNGQPLGVSARQVIFRDLDGVCSYSW
jgi:hypothetical protein